MPKKRRVHLINCSFFRNNFIRFHLLSYYEKKTTNIYGRNNVLGKLGPGQIRPIDISS